MKTDSILGGQEINSIHKIKVNQELVLYKCREEYLAGTDHMKVGSSNLSDKTNTELA